MYYFLEKRFVVILPFFEVFESPITEGKIVYIFGLAEEHCLITVKAERIYSKYILKRYGEFERG